MTFDLGDDWKPFLDQLKSKVSSAEDRARLAEMVDYGVKLGLRKLAGEDVAKQMDILRARFTTFGSAVLGELNREIELRLLQWWNRAFTIGVLGLAP